MKKILLIGNSGSNHNYLGFKLLNLKVENCLTYHKYGTHKHGSGIIDISLFDIKSIEEFIEKDYSVFVCHADRWNDSINELMKKHKIKVFQILIEKNQECLLINWQEKLRINPQDKQDKFFSQEWETQQKQIWQKYTEFPIERATFEWTYKLYDKEFIDVKKIQNADGFFAFGSLYDSYESTRLEFKKFDIEYSEIDYTNWKTSQKLIFDSWNSIKNNINTPKNLKHDYQKGIALALKGINEKLNDQDCWDRYKFLLD